MGFAELGLRSSLLESLEKGSFHAPLEIQELCIPEVLAGEDVVGISETGSGKTLAYALPMLHRIKALEEEKGVLGEKASPYGLVLAPTRELADQITRVLKTFAHKTRLRVRMIAGGVKRSRNSDDLKSAFELLVSTPGRLMRFVDQGRLKLDQVRVLVLDEADQLFEMGFLQELDSILGKVHEDRQLMMFSATLPKAVKQLIKDRFGEAKILQSKRAHKPVDSVSIRQIQVSPDLKFEELCTSLNHLKGKGFIFTNSKGRCADVAKRLGEVGKGVCLLHAGLDVGERKKQLKAFSSSEGLILVCTDLAARGLDFVDVGWIVNYDMPKIPAHYLHRIGRAARLGRNGRVVDLVTSRDSEMIEKLRRRRVTKGQFALDESLQNAWVGSKGKGRSASGRLGKRKGQASRKSQERQSRGPGGGRSGGRKGQKKRSRK